MQLLFRFFMALAIISIYTNAGAQKLTGKVLTERGEPAVGVFVVSRDKTTVSTTNEKGFFSINVHSFPDSLTFSGVGYEPYTVLVTAKTLKDPDFMVVLLTNRGNLNEVVVVGYAAKKKKSEISYSTATVSASAYVSSESATLDKSLAGRTSGIAITTPSSPIPLLDDRAKRKESNIGSATRKILLPLTNTKTDNHTPSSKLLTAGEVNDFAKWKMWEDFTDNEFKTYANNWGLFMKQRYTVMLQTNNHFAAVGIKVFLIDKNTHDTAWTAITDNTGKAELWGGTNKAATNGYYIVANGNEKILNPNLFEVGINRLTLHNNCTENSIVEIAFVVDATGSMGDEIEYLKLELENVLNNTFNNYTNVDVRAASVFYRDNGDEYLTKHTNFNNDFLKTLNFIKLQKAGGGGDMPEAVDAALTTAIDSLEWTNAARAKIMFLILDAPPHNEAKDRMYNLIQKAAAKGIRIVPIVCSGADKSTEFLMRSIALATNGTYLFLTNDSGIGGDHIKPTTDAFNVELLSSLLPRIIQQMVYITNCNQQQQQEPPTKLVDNVIEVQVSPNPTAGMVNIKSSKPLRDIFIADFTGKILLRLNNDTNTTNWKINISNFPSGTYIVKDVTNNNEWGATKLVLIH